MLRLSPSDNGHYPAGHLDCQGVSFQPAVSHMSKISQSSITEFIHGFAIAKKLLKPIMALRGTREFFMTVLYGFVTVRDSLFFIC